MFAFQVRDEGGEGEEPGVNAFSQRNRGGASE